MADELGRILVAVDEDDVRRTMAKAPDDVDAPQPTATANGNGNGALGDMLGGLQETLMGLSKIQLAMLGAIGVVAGVLLSMEPIQEMMKGFLKVFQLFMLPLAKLLLRLFAPIMRMMLKVLPYWLKFFEDPVAGLIGIGEWLWEQIKKIPRMLLSLIEMYLKIWTKIGEILWGALKTLGGWLWDKIQKFRDWLFELPSRIWEFIKQIPAMIGRAIAGVIPGVSGNPRVVHGRVSRYRGSPVEPRRIEQNRSVEVNVTGYHDEQIKQILEKDLKRRI